MKQAALPNTLILEGRMPRVLTRNLTPGVTFFDQEQEFIRDGVAYRELSPKRSKLAAALVKGCQQFGIREGGSVLYLGASHGYTPSFVSDMLGKDGTLFCVEFAPTVARDLVFVCERRENMIPVLADASQPNEYAWRITGVDALFQDIAQRAQLDIFLKNLFLFVKPGGFGMLALKARSVDSARRPDEIFKAVKRQLDSTAGITLVDYRELFPLEKDHAFFVVKRQ
jgi:fibrillarin-like pre-rRNA processing protein